MHDEVIADEFTHQAESFNHNAVAYDPATLDALLSIAAPQPDQRWLDLCCGPGVVSRALAPLTGEVMGVDATSAMIDVAKREADQIPNLTFQVGDATDLSLPDESFDGAVNRFALHHIPVPARVFETLGRVTKPGGSVVVADHLRDVDGDAAAWSLELERLRDPSHWSCLTADQLRRAGQLAGLKLESEEAGPFELDFDDWLARGSGGLKNRAAIERALSDRPDGSDCFQVAQRDGVRVLRLQIWIGRFTR
jgi:ubiquinone/menaquinone biosynthesis C-methylase UbiE